MKFLLSMNQIAYFKPETTARRLKNDYYYGSGNPVHFLGYLRLIRLLPQLASRAKPLQPALYQKEVREIYLDTPWDQGANPWLALFLGEFREFFTAEEWRQLKIRYQRIHLFLGKVLVHWLKDAQKQLTLAQVLQFVTIGNQSLRRPSTKLRC
ncbi:hypothetical protein [Enterococcus sp. 2201sp1_2201st1_B8_2201SCRN_220225]|uniref:hypothetical protein n=1 Tax=unclassified Enterococcus TaxID=2608891 RepID=UPI0034A4F60C